MQNSQFLINQNNRGAITKLEICHDPTNMNWVIDPKYLESAGYKDNDKLFGEFTLTVDNVVYNSIDFVPEINTEKDYVKVIFQIKDILISNSYTLTEQGIKWDIDIQNLSSSKVIVNNFGVWASLAYVMFRDKNIIRNSNQSAAVFSSISPNFTKLAAVRRDNTAPNLGIYQTHGNVLSVGTYNEYCNRFFENVSPSLDGMLFHQLILAGGYPDNLKPKNDWIYPNDALELTPDAAINWEFYLASFTNQSDFYKVAQKFKHPIFEFSPQVTNNHQSILVDESQLATLDSVYDQSKVGNRLVQIDITEHFSKNLISYPVHGLGEHKVIFNFKNGKQDVLIFNKITSIKQLLHDRADYISTKSYQDETYSFTPISNQGESLGKMNFVLQECLLDSEVENIDQKIQQVEKSAVKYVRPKWFVDGNFKQPAKLYGDFYRVMDLEYIAHLFYLLSQCDDAQLKLYSSKEYLLWAAAVFNVRVNPELHDNSRGKEESQMLGQYFLYIEDLLTALKNEGLTKEYEEISQSWEQVTTIVAQESDSLSAAVTEHFFDNAGFGPAAGALAVSGHDTAARKYGELLKANIGFSNDFRAQSPDRWWEALSYMMHALWGGVTAAAALITGRELGDFDLIKASYRGTIALLYMYDSNATATDRILEKGEAASTYSIAGPNLNRPDLSRNRFGQSVFASDGGIFARLFPNGYTGEDDWDMGEELVAYLNGFGQETYLYKNENGDFEVINGEIIKKSNDRLTIQSNAPYPSRYFYVNDNLMFQYHSDIIEFDYIHEKFI